MIPDYNDFCDMHEREVEERMKRLPICNKCGEPITSDYAYDLDGLWCEDCYEEFTQEIRVDMDYYEGD